MKINFITFFIVIIMQTSFAEESFQTDQHSQEQALLETVTSATLILENAEEAKFSTVNCGPAEMDVDEFNQNLGCPELLFRQARKDTKAGIFLKKCEQFLPKYISTKAEALENIFANDPATQLGSRSPMVSSRLCRAISTVGQGRNEPVISNSEARLVTAEYFLNMSRLRSATLSTIESVAAIDSLLGVPLLASGECRDPYIGPSAIHCQKLRQCSPVGGLKESAQAYAEDHIIIQKLEKKLYDLKARSSVLNISSGPGAIPSSYVIEQTIALANQQREVEQQIAAIKGLHPGVEGKVFNKTLDPKKMNYEEAFRKQMEATRNALKESLVRFQAATKCLNSFEPLSECKDIAEVLEATPPFAIVEQAHVKGLDRDQKSKRMLMEAALSEVECHQGIRKTNKERKDAIRDFEIGVGLTIATFGLSTLALTSKVALTAVNAGAKSAKLLQYANKASLARTAIFGLDASIAGVGLHDRLQSCDGQWQEFTQTPESHASETNFCPKKQQYQGPFFMGNYRGCIIAAVLGTSLDLLPFAPAVARQFSDSMRLGRAVELLGNRTLTSVERKAIIDAHYIGLGEIGKDGATKAAKGNYSFQQIAKKARTLKESGFNSNEIRKLMENGIVGETGGFFASLFTKIRGGEEGAAERLLAAEALYTEARTGTAAKALSAAREEFSKATRIKELIEDMGLERNIANSTVKMKFEDALVNYAKSDIDGFHLFTEKIRKLNPSELDKLNQALGTFHKNRHLAFQGVEENIPLLIKASKGSGDEFKLALLTLLDRAEMAKVGDLTLPIKSGVDSTKFSELFRLHFSEEAVLVGPQSIRIDVTRVPKEKRHLLYKLRDNIDSVEEGQIETALLGSDFFNYNVAREELGRLRGLKSEEFVPNNLASFQRFQGYKRGPPDWEILDIPDSVLVDKGGSRRIYRHSDGRSVLEVLDAEGRLQGTEVIVLKDPKDPSRGVSFFSYNEQGVLSNDFAVHMGTNTRTHKVFGRGGCYACHTSKVSGHSSAYPEGMGDKGVSAVVKANLFK